MNDNEAVLIWLSSLTYVMDGLQLNGKLSHETGRNQSAI